MNDMYMRHSSIERATDRLRYHDNDKHDYYREIMAWDLVQEIIRCIQADIKATGSQSWRYSDAGYGNIARK